MNKIYYRFDKEFYLGIIERLKDSDLVQVHTSPTTKSVDEVLWVKASYTKDRVRLSDINGDFICVVINDHLNPYTALHSFEKAGDETFKKRTSMFRYLLERTLNYLK